MFLFIKSLAVNLHMLTVSKTESRKAEKPFPAVLRKIMKLLCGQRWAQKCLRFTTCFDGELVLITYLHLQRRTRFPFQGTQLALQFDCGTWWCPLASAGSHTFGSLLRGSRLIQGQGRWSIQGRGWHTHHFAGGRQVSPGCPCRLPWGIVCRWRWNNYDTGVFVVAVMPSISSSTRSFYCHQTYYRCRHPSSSSWSPSSSKIKIWRHICYIILTVTILS